MKKVRNAVIILLSFIIIGIHTVSLADVGSFDRYDSGSSSDWGSSSSSWDWDDDDDYDYDYGSSSSRRDRDDDYNYGSSSGSDSFGVWFGTINLIMIVAIIIIMISAKSKNGKGPRNYHVGAIPTRPMPVVDPSKSHIYAEKIKEIDPNFSEEKMISFAKDLFVKLQNAWTARDWEPMRPFETESLFEQHKAQVQGYIDTNRINVMDRIAVNYAYLYNFRQEGDRDILEIALKSTMKDYIIDATTNHLLEGSRTQDRTTVYKLTFERKTGVLTPEGTAQIKTTNCPNCGAPTEITSAGKCEYCGSVITTGANTWVLSGLEPLR